jgi:hypothetical protein
MNDELSIQRSAFIVSMIPAFTTTQISKRHFSKCRHFLPPTLKGVNTIFFRVFSQLAITRSGSCPWSAINV